MKFRVTLLSLILASTGLMAQTDAIFPWITNNDLFRGTLIINNLNDSTVTVTLTATRQEGEDPLTQTVTRDIDAFDQLVVTANDLFDQMGDGKGYVVRMTSDSDKLESGFINVGTQSASMTSPAQSNTLAASEATNILMFSYMFIDNGFSAPVVVNMGTDTANLTFHAFQNGDSAGTAERMLAAGHPFTDTTANLFPDLTGDLYLVVESDQPVLATAFIFNTLLEPSMANAVPIDAVPEPNAVDLIDFASQIQPIFASCQGGACHSPGASAGLSLASGSSYDNIVGVPSSQNSDLNRIQPGDPMASYLWLKLNNQGGDISYSGGRMPLNRGQLSPESIQLIADWITQGAPRSAN